MRRVRLIILQTAPHGRRRAAAVVVLGLVMLFAVGVRTAAAVPTQPGAVTAPARVAAALPPGPDPVGAYEVASSQPGLVRVAGWSFDPDDPTTSLAMHVYVGGTAGSAGAEGRRAFTASLARPDVAAAYPGVGENHGLDVTFETAKLGTQLVCLYAINVGPGSNVLVGCNTVTIADPNPRGSFDVASSQPGLVHVAGWSFDPNVPTDTLTMRVFVGGSEQHAFTAAALRPDVAAAHPGVGDLHGLDETFETAQRAAQPVCLHAVNVGAGADIFLGCRTVDIADPDPVGSFDRLRSPDAGAVRVRAWAFDPNAPTAAATVRVYVGGHAGDRGVELHTFTAAAARPDVAVVYPDAGPAHGLDKTFTTAARGDQPVCVYVDNAGPGRHVQLGCKTVTIEGPLSGSPGTDVPTPGVPSGSNRVVGGSKRLRWRYAYTWHFRGGITRFSRMKVSFTGDTAGTTVVVSCHGRSRRSSRREGCPFGRRAFRPNHGVVTPTRLLSRPLRARTVILLTVMRAGRSVGKSIRVVTRRHAGPAQTRVKPSGGG
jgi:hypothetical protein